MMWRSNSKSLEKVPNDAAGGRERRLKDDDVTIILLSCSHSLGNYGFDCHFSSLLAEMNKVQILCHLT